MADLSAIPHAEHRPAFIKVLALCAVAGCVIFAVTILIADFVVPDHDWIADTISDLGAGRYEFIVDIGIYAFSASLIAIALLSAHVHLGGWRWSFGAAGFALLGLIVFLVGARNEYGDNDNDGMVIHVYLIYVLGVLMVLLPLTMCRGARQVGRGYCHALIAIATVWTLSAPYFFFMSTTWDGLYERYLGLIAFALVGTMAKLFLAAR